MYKKSIKQLFLIIIFPLLYSCTSNDAFHRNEISKDCSGENKKKCQYSHYQVHDKYDLAFAEYSERGNAFDRSHVKEVLDKIESVAKENPNGIVLITFIHGWKHNAHPGDSNLMDFKQALDEAAVYIPDIAEGKRRLIGLYVGWRGKSSKIPGVDNVTFWDRKAVAEEVGRGGVTELLLNLDQIDYSNPNNVMIVVGHSFGGAITVSALTDVLTQRIVQSKESEEYRTDNKPAVRGVGDLVMILNPAIEANQSLPLVEAALDHEYSDHQRPIFVSLSTDSDWATHYTFPLGQIIGVINWRQTDLGRNYLHDRETEQDVVLKEEHLDTTTVGNFAPYLTHRLKLDKNSKIKINKCDVDEFKCEPLGITSLNGQPAIKAVPANYPLYFIKTDKTVMTGHSDIFNSVVKKFVISLVNETVETESSDADLQLSIETDTKEDIDSRSIEMRPARKTTKSILNDTEELQKQFEKFDISQ